MVYLSLLFSAHTFYVSLRNLLFQELKAKDKEKTKNIKRYLSTRCRFYVYQSFISICIIVFLAFITIQNNEETDCDGETEQDDKVAESRDIIIMGMDAYNTFEVILFVTLYILLFILQIGVVLGSIFIYRRLI